MPHPKQNSEIDIEISEAELRVLEQVRQQQGLADTAEAIHWLVHDGIQRRLQAMLPRQARQPGARRLQLVRGGQSS